MTRQAQVRSVVQTLKEDVVWGLHHLVMNTVAGSFATPRAARAAIYRLMGVRTQTLSIFDGCTIVGSETLTIGPLTFINRECYFETVAPITIGAKTAIAMQVAFITSTHPFTELGHFNPVPTGLPITVGDRCWLGARAIILPGVTIGDDVVVAAGAIVTKDCASGGLYAGVPARRIRDLGAAGVSSLVP